MSEKVNLSEVFSSFQGEGEFIGCRQVFVRLSGCSFACPYCDTDYAAKDTFDIDGQVHANPVSSQQLADALLAKYAKQKFHSYSFTGGEPLLHSNFVASTASLLKKQSTALLFLETSGLLPIDSAIFDGLFDIMSVDIKAHSHQVLDNMPHLFENLLQFKKTSWYLKFLLDENAPDGTLDKVINCMNKYGIKKLVVQPIDNKISADKASIVFDKLYSAGIAGRLIAQSHKLLSIR